MKKCICVLGFALLVSFLMTAQNTGEANTPGEKPAAKTSKTSTVTIESAQKTEYTKDPETGTELIVLKGGVVLSVVSGDTKTSIKADLINYNRERKMVYAEGNVVLDQYSGNSISESMTSQSLLFNIDTLEGVFDDGRIVQIESGAINLPDGSKLVVASDLFAKNDAGTIAFKNGTLSFCAEDEPHWKIRATRIWLLPGNEFAFFNAFLYVGHVPLVYLPFFYYPKDELIFNPVFGYRGREGYFLQTTTYIIGRKPLDSKDPNAQNKTETEEDLFNFIKPSTLKEQERRGLFLHNLEDDAKDVKQDYIKLMADYYTTLGAFTGIEGKFKPKAVVTDLQFNLGLAFSRRIYSASENLPYHPKTGEVIWDTSYFLGKELPFRHAESLSTGFSFKNFKLTITVPFYSDPYIQSDFGQRSESMDWINFFLDNPILSSEKTEEKAVQKAALSSYKWNIKGSFTPSFPALKPYISTISIQNFESSVLFATKTQTDLDDYDKLYNPNRLFFYPSSIKPGDASAKISGTLLSLPGVKTSASVTNSNKADGIKTKTADEELNLLIPSELQEPELSVIEEKGIEGELPETMLPSISYSSSSFSTFKNFSYSLTYDAAPSINSLITSEVSIIKKPEDFVFEKESFQSSYYHIKSPVSLASAFSVFSELFTLKNSLTFSPQTQEHPYISDTAYPKEEDRIKIILNDYAEKKLDLTNRNEVIIKPLLMTSIFSSSTVNWVSNIKIIRTEFSGSYDAPEWLYKTPEWDKESITEHTAGFVFAAKEGLFSQSLNFTVNLPPLLDSYTGKLTLVFPYVTLSADSGYKKEEKTDSLTGEKTEEFVFVPLTQTCTISFLDKKITLGQSYKYDIDEKQSTSFQASLALFGFRLAYNMLYTVPYELDPAKGWTAKEEKEFQPSDISVSYALPSKNYSLWKNRVSISPGLNTQFRMDLIRPTNSLLSFTPSLNFKIHDFLTLTFSSDSSNDVIFRYFQDSFGYDIKIPGEKNIFKDLIKSFNFSNEVDRLTSGFKLKKLSIKAEHNLHDWTLKSEFSFSPRLKTDKKPYYYDYSPYFSLSVVWNPMKSLKTQIVDDYGTFQLNP
ncbi:MAG TPA: hypothetical protein PLR39_00115 [Treponemataceae bacterium]|nr:hypothetical protein [Treponemataceae bacterium]